MSRILIDIGHGFYCGSQNEERFDPGAVNQAAVSEFSLNVVSAIALQQRLQSLGQFAAFCPYGLSRFDRGLAAAGYDCFISVHHNAAGKPIKQQYVRVLHNKNSHTAQDRILAERVAEAIANILTITNFDAEPANLEVLRAARKTNVKASILTEAFFIDQGLSEAQMRIMARNAGYAIAQAVHEYFYFGG